MIPVTLLLCIAEGFFLGIAFTLFKHTRPIFRTERSMEDTAAGAFILACAVAVPALYIIAYRIPNCFQP